MHELTAWRAKPAVYFGGKFRIIDFPLSNCINSGIRRIGVLFTQYKAHSDPPPGGGLEQFQTGAGRNHGNSACVPALQQIQWYQGTADAIYQNIDIISALRPKYLLILSGDHVCQDGLWPLIAQHVESGADA